MHKINKYLGLGLAAALCGSVFSMPAISAPKEAPALTKANAPWLNPALTPEQRIKAILPKMTQKEKLTLTHGIYGVDLRSIGMKQAPLPKDVIGSAGYIFGIPRLGIPVIQETDASLGIANPMSVRKNDIATALPSSLATAASFDRKVAYEGGVLIGNEAHNKGFNVLLGGGVNLAREPRNGRNFEYLGEDPLLAGTLDGETIKGTQSQHVISTIKHFAVNDQENDRMFANSLISEKGMRESDLLAFEIAIEIGHPGSVMCGYNLVNNHYDCDNDHLLNGVLKGDWKYPGYVMSDWGAVHNFSFLMHGLDQESAVEFDTKPYFRDELPAALKSGKVPESRLDDMVSRILYGMFSVGIINNPPKVAKFDYKGHVVQAQHTAEAGMVLLKNTKGTLPLIAKAQKIAIIGGAANFGVVSGGGSSNVIPKGSLVINVNSSLAGYPDRKVYHPSSPMKAIQKLNPKAQVKFVAATYADEAAKVAKWADVVIVFATKWQTEGKDVPSLSLPNGQDQLIDKVADANHHTIVVLETGNPVTMPWLNKVPAVLEAWFPGIGGGQAIANILYGKVNPSGHLPITFPKSVQQDPRQDIPGYGVYRPFFSKSYSLDKAIPVKFNEGSDIGYRWFAKKHETPLFPFGYGLSYTSFSYSNMHVSGGKTVSVSFDVTNTGKVAGKDAPQLYLTNAAGEQVKRLIGFTKVSLKPGETKHVTLKADRRFLADYSVKAHAWKLKDGTYKVALSRSADDAVKTASTHIMGATINP